MADERGDPWEHDPGPTTASGWAALFAETPNYRGLGRAVVGQEAFRWHHGPMFFRGRLDGSAKVVLVGQEGAQDESLSHRSFTGGTGARMQHLLRHLGLDRSYLFLNSFVDPIFGQYTDDLRPLAQDRRSPIVAHRHRILDKAIVDGDVRLVVAVGRAAKESVATWIRPTVATPTPNGSTGPPLGRCRTACWPSGWCTRTRPPAGRPAPSRPTSSGPATWSGTGSRPTPAGCRPTRGSTATWPPPSSTGRRPSPSATSRSGPARGWAAAGPPATAPTTSGASSCSRPPAATTPPVSTCAMGPRPGAAATATATTPATCPTSRPGAPRPPSTPARRPPWPGCCWGWSPGSAGRTLPPLGSPPTRRSGWGRSTGAGSATSAWSCWPTRPPRTTCSPGGRCPGRTASGWSGSCAPPG